MPVPSSDQTTLHGGRADGRHADVTYPEGMGGSRLGGTLIESKLRTRGTGRNWNTVLKLAALVQS